MDSTTQFGGILIQQLNLVKFISAQLASDLLCCDSEMIQIMEANFVMASGLFGRCETCMKNFQKSICAFNCSPKQSKFLTPHTTSVKQGEDNEPGKMSSQSISL